MSIVFFLNSCVIVCSRSCHTRMCCLLGFVNIGTCLTRRIHILVIKLHTLLHWLLSQSQGTIILIEHLFSEKHQLHRSQLQHCSIKWTTICNNPWIFSCFRRNGGMSENNVLFHNTCLSLVILTIFPLWCGLLFGYYPGFKSTIIINCSSRVMASCTKFCLWSKWGLQYDTQLCLRNAAGNMQ